MKNFDAIAAIAAKEGKDQVCLIEEISLKQYALSIWRTVGSLPARKIAILDLGEKKIVTTSSLKNFELLLKIIKPDLNNQELILSLFTKASPPGRTMLTRSDEVLPKYKEIWHSPRLQDGDLVFFCNDFLHGKFERVGINSEYDFEVKEIGPGKKYRLR